MKILLLVAIACVAVVLAVFAARARPPSGDGPAIHVREVPRAIAELRQRGGEHSFLVFMFDPPGRPGSEAINLQLSIDKGRLGLDWVLLSPSNQADRSKIEEFIRKRGHSVGEQRMNGVSLLRVEDGDLAALASAILTGFYGLGSEAKLETVVEGFSLGPSR